MGNRVTTRIGLLPADEQAPGSADLAVFHEPLVGSQARTKGNLYLLAQVTGTASGLRRAAADSLEAIEREFYYDLSAGIAVSLARAMRVANRRLFHGRVRYGIGRHGGVSVVALVIAGREAHVAKVGPAAAVVVRERRMYEVPPPPAAEDEDPRVRRRRVAATLGEAPDVEAYAWQGEVTAGDSLALVSRNLAHVIGVAELRRSMAALRPSSAVEHLHHLFTARRGDGSDGIMIIELLEVPSTVPPRRLEPVRPAEPLAGLPDQSPVPLADAIGHLGHQLAAAGGRLRRGGWAALVRTVAWIYAFVPRRRTAYPRRISRTAVRDAGRRRRVGMAGIAVSALLLATAGMLGDIAGPSPTEAIQRAEVAREAVAAAQQALEEVERTVQGAGLVERSPDAARELLNQAHLALGRARAAGVDAGSLLDFQHRVDAGLDLLYGVTRIGDVRSVVELSELAEGASASRMVTASDGTLWIVEPVSGQVLRADPSTGSVALIYRAGQVLDNGTAGQPWLITSAATDVVVIDRERQAWRIDLREQMPRRMALAAPEKIGTDPLVGSVQHRPPLEVFTLYVVDRRAGTIWKWTPEDVIPVDYLAPPEAFLLAEPDLPPEAARDVRVDTDLWLLHADTVTKVSFGTPLPQIDYALGRPPDVELRPTLDYRFIDAAVIGDRELLYVYDAANARIVAFARGDGSFVRQWMAPSAADGPGPLADVRGLTVISTVEGPAVAYLLAADEILRVVLE
jgi:hypothetical protein